MRTFATIATALLLALAACGGAADGAADFGAWDEGQADVPLLSDAVVLEPGGRPDAGPSDTAAPADLPGDVPAFDLPATDVAAADAGPGWDAAGDTGAYADAAPSDGTNLADEGGPSPDAAADLPAPGDAVGGQPCGDEGLACRPDQACVADSDGTHHCAPLGECSGKGAIDPEALVKMLLAGQGEVRVKVLAMPWPGKPACSPNNCGPGESCCKACFAPLFIGAEPYPVALMGKGVAVGCQGTECDVLDLCRPFLLDSWYWVWGVAKWMGGQAEFVVEGFCPADLQALPF